jgi:hypothetical protein
MLFFVLIASVNGGNRVLASTIIPSSNIGLGSSYIHTAIYPPEPNIYGAEVYFTLENSRYYYYTRCLNSQYGCVILRVYYT